jgi:phosphatidylglycerophosphate synthase
MKHLPIALIYFRFCSGIVILALSVASIPHYEKIAATLFSLGLLSDILDGVIARRLQVASQKLRRLDSLIDQLFFLLVTLAVFNKWPAFFTHNAAKILILVSTECAAYLLCLLKFRREVATHAISSKLWSLVLFATLVQVLLTGNSTNLFNVCFYLGLVTRLEIIGIILLLRGWTHDVPSLYHAYLVRRGQALARHPLLN